MIDFEPFEIDDGMGGTITVEPLDEADVPPADVGVFARRFTGSLGGGFSYLGDGTCDLLLMQDGAKLEILTMVLTGLDPRQISVLTPTRMVESARAGGGYEIPITVFAGWFGR